MFSSDLSSFSGDSTKISVYEQSYVFPRSISAIATTSTKYGISIKDVIGKNSVCRWSIHVVLTHCPVAGTNYQIQSFPRRFLDPRRPHRKPTAEEQEEWLMQYDPLIPDDPKHVLSHKYQVCDYLDQSLANDAYHSTRRLPASETSSHHLPCSSPHP